MMMKIIMIVVIPVLCVHVCVCARFQGDANRSETDDERQSLSFEDEEKLRELYAAGTNLELQTPLESP